MIMLVLSPVAQPAFASTFAPELHVDVNLNVGDTILTVEGKTAPNAFVTILRGSTTIGTTSANSSGLFSRSFPAQSSGTQTIRVFAKTSDGKLTDTVSKNINLASQTETTVTFFLPTTIELASQTVQVGDDITFSGRTVPGATITLSIDNMTNRTVATNSAGVWSHSMSTTGFYIGMHNVFAIVNTQLGEYSQPTSQRMFQVIAAEQSNAMPPEEQTPPVSVTVPGITEPTDRQQVTKDTVIIRGLSESNVQIELWDGDTIIGSVFANHLGEWQLEFQPSNSQHLLRVRACIQDVCSGLSSGVTVFFDSGQAEQSLILLLDRYRHNVQVGSGASIGMSIQNGQKPYELIIDWGDTTTESIGLERSGYISPKHTYQDIGHYTGTVSVRDSDGLVQTKHFSVLVSVRTDSSLTLGSIGFSMSVAVLVPTLLVVSRGWWWGLLINRWKQFK